MIMGMKGRLNTRGFTLLELAMSLLLVALLVAVLVPTLSTARQAAHRDVCSNNQRQIGEAWQTYLADHDQVFPVVPVQPGWQYAGMRFSSTDGSAFPDYQRPLNAYLSLPRTRDYESVVCSCPADRGITDLATPGGGVGTGDRTAFRSFGISYRANAALLTPQRLRGHSDPPPDPPEHDHAIDPQIDNDLDRAATRTIATASAPPVPGAGALRGLSRDDITVARSRLVMMGDPVWYEVAEETGRSADWHGRAGWGNLLFLDGSVRFQEVRPKRIAGPIVFDPRPQSTSRQVDKSTSPQP
jgi:prepilin-type processing-associated H-X9-DG protein